MERYWRRADAIVAIILLSYGTSHCLAFVPQNALPTGRGVGLFHDAFSASVSVIEQRRRRTTESYASNKNDNNEEKKSAFLFFFGSKSSDKSSSQQRKATRPTAKGGPPLTPSPSIQKTFNYRWMGVGRKEEDTDKPKPQSAVRPGKSSPLTPKAFSSSSTRKMVEEVNDDEEEGVEVFDDTPLGNLQSFFAAATKRLQTPFDLGPALVKLGFFTVGFFGGAGAGIILLLSPSGNLPESITRPITLFENILLEIDRGYVEKVDDKKLFEAAVDSMLSTLDPYTEFEGEQTAKDMREAVSGRYGGVGLVIAGTKSPSGSDSSIIDETIHTTTPSSQKEEGGAIIEGGGPITQQQQKGEEGKRTARTSPIKKGKGGGFRDGITVVSAFEGYAFDAGMRVGDRLIAVDGVPVSGRSVDQVRDLLRGVPESKVKVKFERAGVSPPSGEDGIELELTRRLVRVPDVKLTSYLGPPEDGIGYIQLGSFSQNAPLEIRLSLDLLRAHSPNGVKGIILDLRNNPGGLLTSAVDVASLLVPRESEIVSAKGRAFPAVSYVSSLNPVRDLNVPLAVLVNSGTASAAEIVSGAVQDLDSGVIVGADRTYGKGLVQNVEPLPYNTALKYTVAKYYTPSGRCIQSVRYTPKDNSKAVSIASKSRQGAAALLRDNNGYDASDIPDSERKEFYTKNGRIVRDGGGVEADVKVESPQASILEVTLQTQGAFFDFATEWAKTHKYNGEGTSTTSKPLVNEDMYNDFKQYVTQQVKKGDLKMDLLFSGSLEPLGNALEETGYKKAKTDLTTLKEALNNEVETEFSTHKDQIKEQIEEAILARYLPESLLRRLALDNDPQVKVALETVKDASRYEKLLNGPNKPRKTISKGTKLIISQKSLSPSSSSAYSSPAAVATAADAITAPPPSSSSSSVSPTSLLDENKDIVMIPQSPLSTPLSFKMLA